MRITNCPFCGHCLLPTTKITDIRTEQVIRAYEAFMKGENR